MRDRLITISITLVSLLVIINGANFTARAQAVQGSPNASKTTGTVGPAKSTDVATIILPKLRLRGAEAYHIGGTSPKDMHKVIFTFSNWDKFPAKWFQPAPDSPNLPPNPCRQIYSTTRMFLILHSEDGQIKRCAPLTSKEDFYFLLEKDKPIPNFVYVEVTDRTNGKTFKSTLVSPSTGLTK